MSVPIGSIVASVLSVTDFLRQVPAGEKWQQADGTKIDNGLPLAGIILRGGADYEEVREVRPNPADSYAKTPNLNGVFLRGRDYGHQQELRNPEGSLKVGHLQLDDVGPHWHSQKVGYQNVMSPGAGDPVWQGTASDNTGGPVADGNYLRQETRPKNVTVNFFIRVK